MMERIVHAQERLERRHSALMWEQELERQRRWQRSQVQASPAVVATEAQVVVAGTAAPTRRLGDSSDDEPWSWGVCPANRHT